MALTDVDLTSADSRIVCELPAAVYSGVLGDAVTEAEDSQSVAEMPRHYTYSKSRVVNGT